MKITLDKIASSTARLGLPREVEISPHIEAKEGNVLAVRALMEKSVYDRLELDSGPHGEDQQGRRHGGHARIPPRAQGLRRASCPESIHAGDTIHVLNLGGVLGALRRQEPATSAARSRSRSWAPILLDGKPANISQNALPPRDSLADVPAPRRRRRDLHERGQDGGRLRDREALRAGGARAWPPRSSPASRA